MRRWLILLVLTMALPGLCACGKDKKTNKTESKTTTEATASTTSSASATSSSSAATTDTTTGDKGDDTTQQQSDIVNIALFGVDQESGEAGRSDTVMILSVDYDNAVIKTTSLARDTLVPIPEHGEQKLAHAWAYGGVELALRTVNEAFHTQISDYVYVNLEEFVTLVDLMDGVEVSVNEVELNAINSTTNEAEKLPGTGVHRLNSAQALRYVRCRTDSDANRTARQRTLIKAMLEEAQTLSAVQLAKLIGSVQEVCHTNLSDRETTKFISLLTLRNPTMEEMSLPDARLNPWSGILDSERGWVYVYDLDYAAALLYDFIYDDDTAADLPKPTRYQSG